MPDNTIEIIARGALICSRRLLLCRNRKHGHVFLPGGHVEFGEPARAALEREMREETGYLPKKVERLGGFYASPGFCTEYMHLYLAYDLVPDRLYAEDTDSIELVRVPLSEVAGLIASGDICDAKSIAGLLLYLSSKKSASS